MKRVILGTSRDDGYAVVPITECPFDRMVAFNVVDTAHKQELVDMSSINTEYVVPHREILSMHEASADSILEELSEYYRRDVTPNRVASVLSSDGCSGLLAERDGTLILIGGHFDRFY